MILYCESSSCIIAASHIKQIACVFSTCIELKRVKFNFNKTDNYKSSPLGSVYIYSSSVTLATSMNSQP
jgi:hypothetical protein